MKTENASQAAAAASQDVTALTPAETQLVAGGLLLVGTLSGGCRACTSGLQLAFANLAAVINPAPEL